MTLGMEKYGKVMESVTTYLEDVHYTGIIPAFVTFHAFHEPKKQVLSQC